MAHLGPAHDICADYAEHGVDVTLFQRSSTCIMSTKEGMPTLMKPNYWEGGPPTEVADLIDNTMPILYRKMVHKRITKDIAEADKCVLPRRLRCVRADGVVTGRSSTACTRSASRRTWASTAQAS